MATLDRPTSNTELQPNAAERRKLLKRALVACAYVAPIVASFSSKELVRAASQPTATIAHKHRRR